METQENNGWEAPSGEELAKEFAELEAKEAGDQNSDSGTNVTPAQDNSLEQKTVEQSPEEPAIPEAPADQMVEPSFEERLAEYERQQTQYLQVIAHLQEQVRAAQSGTKTVEKPVEQQELTLEQLDALWKKNPIAAMQAAAMASPEVKAMRETIEQFKRAEAERAEQSFAQRIGNQQAEVQRKYEDFKPGTAVYQAAYNYVLKNRGWLRQVAEQDPSFNVVEHAYRQVAFDLRDKLVKAQNKKLVDKRSKSASVKPGGTAPVTPASGSAARDAASDLAQDGTPVPDSWVNAAERAFARFS